MVLEWLGDRIESPASSVGTGRIDEHRSVIHHLSHLPRKGWKNYCSGGGGKEDRSKTRPKTVLRTVGDFSRNSQKICVSGLVDRLRVKSGRRAQQKASME